MDMVTATLMFMAAKASMASKGPQPELSEEACDCHRRHDRGAGWSGGHD